MTLRRQNRLGRVKTFLSPVEEGECWGTGTDDDGETRVVSRRQGTRVNGRSSLEGPDRTGPWTYGGRKRRCHPGRPPILRDTPVLRPESR